MKKFIPFTLLILFPLYAFSLETWKEIGNEDNIIILSKPAKNGVLPFKAIGVIDSDSKTLLSILKDHSQKPKWAPKLEKVILHKQISKSEFIFSEYYKTPWPASDREFLLKGTILTNPDNTISLKAYSVDQSKDYSHLKSERHVQADVKYLNLTLKEIAPQKTEIEFEFHGDMKGWMPLWLMNLIQKKWPLRFIQGLRKQSIVKKVL
jgi:hypothetical protein